MRIEDTLDGNLVKVVLAGAHRSWLDENRRPRSQKSMSIPLTSAARRSGPSGKSTSARLVSSKPMTMTSHGRRLSLKRPKRERTKREREREWQGESSCIDLGGEQTPIVHATDHSLKATSVTIASAGLRSPGFILSAPVSERAHIEN